MHSSNPLALSFLMLACVLGGCEPRSCHEKCYERSERFYARCLDRGEPSLECDERAQSRYRGCVRHCRERAGEWAWD